MIPIDAVQYLTQVEKYPAIILALESGFGWVAFKYFSGQDQSYKDLKATITLTETRLAGELWTIVLDTHYALFSTEGPPNYDAFQSPFAPDAGLQGTAVQKILVSTKKHAWPIKAKDKLRWLYPVGLHGGLGICGTSFMGILLTGFKIDLIWLAKLVKVEALLIAVVFLSLWWFSWIKSRLFWDVPQEGQK